MIVPGERITKLFSEADTHSWGQASGRFGIQIAAWDQCAKETGKEIIRLCARHPSTAETPWGAPMIPPTIPPPKVTTSLNFMCYSFAFLYKFTTYVWSLINIFQDHWATREAPCIYTYTYICILYRLLQDIEYSSLCYTVGSFYLFYIY